MHPEQHTEISRYCEAYSSPEPALLTEMVRFTWLHMVNPRQLSGHLQGRLLSMLSFILKPETVLEIGTFSGYATLCMAEGLSKTGVLHTIEADGETAWKAARQFEKSPFAEKIKVHHGAASDILPGLHVSADLIFVDADKQGYSGYLDQCLPLLSDRGLLIFDNTLWSGKVADPQLRETDADTRSMHEFNKLLAARTDLEVLILPLRDGLTLVRKR